MIEEFTKLIPESLLSSSGSVFYSGRSAFETKSNLYILGLNPGGSPTSQANETIEWHTNNVINSKPNEWSEYQDEMWAGRPKGTCSLQPRVLHLLKSLDLNPQNTPSSNLVFLRTAREHDLSERFSELAEICWPFHQKVIEQLEIKTILCFGKSAGHWVKNKLNANTLIGEFEEKNKRKWKSHAYANNEKTSVVIAAHPSIAAWQTPATDPTPLVREAIKFCTS